MRPISCEGGNFDLIKIPLVTLIDALDMLVIVQDFDEFRKAVALVVEQLPKGFDFDVNVSVFETTIRLLGGLLSAHLFAIDPQLQIYPVSYLVCFSLLDISMYFMGCLVCVYLAVISTASTVLCRFFYKYPKLSPGYIVRASSDIPGKRRI